ncbi:hypothetical protein [Streptomyces longwoodensis]|uniref:hypothetical protein n=1 Tax=Streptomyces longwoodensis TaxID=68231 RepID=UPI0036F5288B
MSTPRATPPPHSHTEPETLTLTFPPLAQVDELAQLRRALASGLDDCFTCMSEYRELVGKEAPHLAFQALSMVLLYGSIVLNAYDRPHGTNAEELMQNLAPDTTGSLYAATRAVLRSLPVQGTRKAPDGSTVAEWDKDKLGELIMALEPDEQRKVWGNALGLLVGIARGDGRARAEAGL